MKLGLRRGTASTLLLFLLLLLLSALHLHHQGLLNLSLSSRKTLVGDGTRDDAAGLRSEKGHVRPSLALFTLVLTAPDHREQRTAIRLTWARHDRTRHGYRFFIAAHGLPETVLQPLREEQAQHQDMVLLSHAREEYGQLTAKVLACFQWVANAAPFEPDFVLKGDDDTFVRVPLVLQELDQLAPSARTNLYWGYFDGRAPVRRAGKWAEASWFLSDRYLPYALGGGYVLSGALVHYLADHGERFLHFHSEDVSVGLWLAPLNLTRWHDVRFDTEWKSRGCNNGYLVMHKQSPGDMYTKQSVLDRSTGKLVCEAELQRRPAYVYRWDLPPIDCCPGRGLN